MNENLIIASAGYEHQSAGSSIIFILIYSGLFLGLLGIIYVKK